VGETARLASTAPVALPGRLLPAADALCHVPGAYRACRRPKHPKPAKLKIDDTRAVEPLERTALWEQDEVPETYPCAV